MTFDESFDERTETAALRDLVRGRGQRVIFLSGNDGDAKIEPQGMWPVPIAGRKLYPEVAYARVC